MKGIENERSFLGWHCGARLWRYRDRSDDLLFLANAIQHEPMVADHAAVAGVSVGLTWKPRFGSLSPRLFM